MPAIFDPIDIPFPGNDGAVGGDEGDADRYKEMVGTRPPAAAPASEVEGGRGQFRVDAAATAAW